VGVPCRASDRVQGGAEAEAEEVSAKLHLVDDARGVVTTPRVEEDAWGDFTKVNVLESLCGKVTMLTFQNFYQVSRRWPARNTQAPAH
jgi:hypothetical protein